MHTSTASTARLQQHATRAVFFLPGFATAAWAPLVPYARNRTGLDEASLGLALLCLGTGSMLAMPLAGALAARVGCRRVLLLTLMLAMSTLPLLTVAATPLTLGITLFVFGAGVGACDCIMNMQAVMVERDAGRPMMSGFHAFYSIGGAVGAAAMTVLLWVGIAPWVAVLLLVGGMAGVTVMAAPHWRRDRAPDDAPMFAAPHGVVLLIGVMCFVAFLAEGVMLDWSAVFLHDVQGVPERQAGVAFFVFAVAMTLTRLAGDRVITALGYARAIFAGTVVAAAGFALATFGAGLTVALPGYALIGIGCANVVPALFSLAGRQKVMPESLAIPAVTTLGYAGVLAGPALIGFVAHASSLVVAFCLAMAALLLVGLLGQRAARA